MSADVVSPRTSPVVYLALGLLAFAAAAPFIGSVIQDRSPDGADAILGAFFAWSLIGLAAGCLGVACAIFGAWRGPRSLVTIIGVTIAALWTVAVIVLMALLLH
jgi:hypothetical protein